MQMWAGDAAARSTPPDGVTLFYVGALPDQKFRETRHSVASWALVSIPSGVKALQYYQRRT